MRKTFAMLELLWLSILTCRFELFVMIRGSSKLMWLLSTCWSGLLTQCFTLSVLSQAGSLMCQLQWQWAESDPLHCTTDWLHWRWWLPGPQPVLGNQNQDHSDEIENCWLIWKQVRSCTKCTNMSFCNFLKWNIVETNSYDILLSFKYYIWISLSYQLILDQIHMKASVKKHATDSIQSHFPFWCKARVWSSLGSRKVFVFGRCLVTRCII